MFNFIKKLGKRVKNIKLGQRVKNIFKISNYKEMYEKFLKKIINWLEGQIEGTRPEGPKGPIGGGDDDNDFDVGIDGPIGLDTIQGIRLDLLETLFNRGEVQLGRKSNKKLNRYLTTNKEFLIKWYEVIEKDKQGIKPKDNISSLLRTINKELAYYFSGQSVFESYEYDDGEWQLFVLEDAMNRVFEAFDISPAMEDMIIRR